MSRTLAISLIAAWFFASGVAVAIIQRHISKLDRESSRLNASIATLEENLKIARADEAFLTSITRIRREVDKSGIALVSLRLRNYIEIETIPISPRFE